MTTFSNSTGFWTPTTKTTSQADTDANLDIINENAKRELLNSYNQQIQNAVNNLNAKGMFGSSVANEDIGRVNYNQGQALSNLAGLTAQNKINAEDKTDALNLQLQQLKMQQEQFEQQQQMQQEQQAYARKLAEQQRLDNLKATYGSKYWLYS